MEIGTIFKWNNYPKSKDGIIKPRWFIYLGNSSILSDSQNVFLFTTTSKTALYESGQSRENNKNIMKFKEGEFGFDEDCVLDPFFFKNNCTIEEFEKCKSDFETKGKLTNEKLRIFYENLYKENRIETIIKKDIRRNLNNIRIFNLKMPK